VADPRRSGRRGRRRIPHRPLLQNILASEEGEGVPLSLFLFILDLYYKNALSIQSTTIEKKKLFYILFI
jgi:hypothetical protein